MRRYFSSSAARAADRRAAERSGVPGEVLMENAGRGAAEIIAERFPEAKDILVLCGPGNNGGDGFVAARHLRLAGASVVVVATRGVGEYEREAAFAASSAEKSGIRAMRSLSLSDDEIASLAERADLVVDALLGTGSKGAPRGEAERLIKLSPRSARVVALDVPSGVDSDTGEVPGVAMRAEMTVAFLAEKPGLAIAPGMFFAGETAVAGIGVAPEDVLDDEPAVTGYDASDIGLFAPRISRGIHKGSRGALLIIGGSSNYRGAPALSALAALRAGCGLVALAVPESLAAGAGTLLPEAIFVPLPEKNGHISFDGLGAALRPYFEKFDAVVAGPGLGRSPDVGRAVEFLHGECPLPMLIDADALRFGCKFRRSGVVATPHAGEAAHILGISPEDVDKRRLESCAALAAKFGTAVLKGPHTLISDGRERRLVLEGGPELAVPGSGDVLSGIIGAYLASGMAPMDAATLGALIHGVSGALSARGNPSGLLAREIADGITNVLYKA